jgi:hypothetical protein
MWETTHWASGLNAMLGGRLVSLTDVNARGKEIVKSYRTVTEMFPSVVFGGHLVNPGNGVKDPEGKLSAVHPVWRNTADVGIYLYFTPPCSSAFERQNLKNQLTFDIGNYIRAPTPNSAVYSNEVKSFSDWNRDIRHKSTNTSK